MNSHNLCDSLAIWLNKIGVMDLNFQDFTAA